MDWNGHNGFFAYLGAGSTITDGRIVANRRNPIFVGIIFISFGFFLLLPNPITLTILALDIALIQIQVAMEEEYLTKQHGDSYIEYCQHVRRWL